MPKRRGKMENVIFSEDGANLKVHLALEIDHHTAKGIREKIDEMLFRLSPDVLELDFSEVRFMDSSGIGLIIGRAELMCELGGQLRILGLSHTLRRIVKLSGIEKIKNITIM